MLSGPRPLLPTRDSVLNSDWSASVSHSGCCPPPELRRTNGRCSEQSRAARCGSWAVIQGPLRRVSHSGSNQLITTSLSPSAGIHICNFVKVSVFSSLGESNVIVFLRDGVILSWKICELNNSSGFKSSLHFLFSRSSRQHVNISSTAGQFLNARL